jgi:hypothetical protein
MAASSVDRVGICQSSGCEQAPARAATLRCSGQEEWYGRCEGHWAFDQPITNYARICGRCVEPHFCEAEVQLDPLRIKPTAARNPKDMTDYPAMWRDIEAEGGVEVPAEGVAIAPDRYGYKQRKSSLTQAEHWNLIFAQHPTYSPDVCGFKVGAAEKKVDGYFPLIWVKSQ